ncbi:MAG: hypothetical protein M1816_000706 [Peltula sp. TS41687]|nr:MAG: hypothetical protein M1816_000706 [Peltula sp. TS41687]
MKKVLNKLKEHAGTSHHDHRDRERAHDGDDDDGLKASRYDETVPKAPPTIGERPIKGDLHLDPSRTVDSPASRRQDNMPSDDAQTGLAMQPGGPPIEQRHDRYQLPPQDQGMPTNFSRLSIGKSDGGARTRANMSERNLPPTPSTIQPQDLDSPEFSYLSTVYGRSNPDRSHPNVLPAEQPSPIRQTDRPSQYIPDPHLNASPGFSSSDQIAPSHSLGGSPSRAYAMPVPTSPSRREPAIARKPLPDDVSRVSGRPESETIGDEGLSSASRLSSAGEGDEVPSLEGVLNLGNSVDTEVITEQAPAVVHETIIPKVHHIREEKIVREIHTKDIIHRIQPIIDVEVLPPRHFVPDGHGGLREISADQLPGRRGHWGIVETVTKAPGDVTEQRPLPPTEPQIVSQRSYVTEDGIPRTETVWRHPPELATGGEATGQTWPLLVDPEPFEKRDGPLRAPHNLQRSAPIPFEPKPLDPTSVEGGYAIDESALHSTSTGEVEGSNMATSSVSLTTGATTSMGPGSAPVDLNTTSSRGEVPGGDVPRVPRRDVRGVKQTMPGAFPSLSSSTTATMKTFSER